MIVIDKLCYQSKLRYCNAGEKFAFAIVTLLICVISRSIVIAGLVLVLNWYLNVSLAGHSSLRYRRLLLIPLTFLILSTLAIVVNVSKTPLDAYAIFVNGWYITGSKTSIRFGIQLILTALASVSCLYSLSLNTPMTDILGVLEKLHCPALVIELMLLIYRFIFVLLGIAYSISTSQDARLGNKDYKTSLHSYGLMISVLFIRAMKKSNALYDAMEARCYDGKLLFLTENYPPKKKEITAIVIVDLILFLLMIGLKLYN